MKGKSKSKRSNRAGKRGRTSKNQAPSQAEVLERIRAVVLSNAVEMAEAVCEAGRRGSYLHTKFMYETAALYPAAPQASASKSSEVEEAESLAELVLKRLELDEIEKQEREAGIGLEEAVETGAIT